MARIRYIAPSPKAGQIDHVQPHIAETLVSAGLAEHVAYKDFRERLAAEFSPSAPPPVVEWGVQDASVSRFSKVNIVKRVGAETTFYDAPPADCPLSIRARFESLTATVSGCDLEKARREQYEQHEKEKLGYFGTLYGRTK